MSNKTITESNNRMQAVNQVFNFKNTSFTIITNEQDGSIWFIGKEVATALGYENTSLTLSRHTKGGIKTILPSKGGYQEATIIPESDVYRLIMKSNKAEAEAFQDWVTMEVLPAIRKTGSFNHFKEQQNKELSTAKESLELFESSLKVANLIFDDSNVAKIAANKMVLNRTSVNLLKELGAEYLTAEKQEQIYTPTQLGEKLNLKSRAINPLLIALGFQTADRSTNRIKYSLTNKGRQYGRYSDVSTNNSKSMNLVNIQWYESIIPELRKSLIAMEAGE
jgi:prophage antirepressor-like protein